MFFRSVCCGVERRELVAFKSEENDKRWAFQVFSRKFTLRFVVSNPAWRLTLLDALRYSTFRSKCRTHPLWCNGEPEGEAHAWILNCECLYFFLITVKLWLDCFIMSKESIRWCKKCCYPGNCSKWWKWWKYWFSRINETQGSIIEKWKSMLSIAPDFYLHSYRCALYVQPIRSGYPCERRISRLCGSRIFFTSASYTVHQSNENFSRIRVN